MAPSAFALVVTLPPSPVRDVLSWPLCGEVEHGPPRHTHVPVAVGDLCECRFPLPNRPSHAPRGEKMNLAGR